MENESRTRRLLDEITAMIPEENQRLRNYLSALDSALIEDEKKLQTLADQMAEHEEAYEKLTAPSNRTGVFLQEMEDGIALIAVGDSEFIVSIDPKLDSSLLYCGARVKVNDAYAIVGALPPHPGGQIIRVSEALKDGRLKVGEGTPGTTGGRVVLVSRDLFDIAIKPGDEVLVEPNQKVAVEHIPQAESKEYFFEDIPEIEWEKVGGQKDAIALIKDTIEHPLLFPEIYAAFEKKPIKGILLYGPPGCGKTLIGKATAHNITKAYSERLGKKVEEYFMYISGPKILNMWLGETERMVREIFQTAREKAKEGKLVFIFFDEAESVLRTRSNSRWLNISNTVVPQFCAELDGLVELENVVLILTSNRPDYIDPAILRPERIDRKVKINRPDQDATRDIFSIYLNSKIPLDPVALAAEGGDSDSLRNCFLDSIAAYLWRTNQETEYLRVSFRNGGEETLFWKDLVSGALIKSIVDRAKDNAIKRAVDKPKAKHGIRLDDLKEAALSEFQENEIFPKNDAVEDWLKLLDFEEENVVSLRAVRSAKKMRRDTII